MNYSCAVYDDRGDLKLDKRDGRTERNRNM